MRWQERVVVPVIWVAVKVFLPILKPLIRLVDRMIRR